MGIFDKWFNKKLDTGSTTQLAKNIGSLTDKLARDIFVRFGSILKKEPITYVVPAIWGTRENGELDEDQKEIFGLAAPVVKEVLTELDLKGLSPSQDFAIGFIVRGLIVSKITYMITAANKAEQEREEATGNKYAGELEHMEPMGNA